ncbi:hypothetical protein [Rhodococcus sp. ACT016]|uniref:DUF7822 domain-containing protein n=1 Tax=Rhodococcus sp. ACT016 TaxID=3134808 RepID=UPI003D2C84B1
MANRSYLYTTSFAPDTDTARTPADRVSGISEWPYAIPLVFRILVSADPRPCRSLIWNDGPDPTAITGRCGPGIIRLEQFLARIDHPALGSWADDAIAFLRAHTEPDGHFVLECAEIFAMDDAPVGEQYTREIQALSELDTEIDATLARLAPTKPNFWQRVFKPSQESLEAPIRELGLGYWSDTLYCDLDNRS